MNTFIEIFTNKYFVGPLVTGILAQTFKFFLYWFLNKKPDFRWLFYTGGMPSAHSASVMALSTIVGFDKGFDSALFGITLYFSLIVMYDAAGLRRAAGMQARVINRMVEELKIAHKIREERLRELLGHTPFEVLAGAMLGILAGIIMR